MRAPVNALLRASVVLAVLAACGAAPNPAPSGAPIAWEPPPKETRTAEPAPRADPSSSTSNASAASSASPRPATTTNDTPSTKPAPADPAPRAPVTPSTNDAQDASKPAASTSSTAASTASNGLVIATVAGKPLDASELVAQWVHHKSSEALDELDHLVLTRLVAAEAGRLGVELSPEEARDAYDKAIAEMEKEVQKRRPGLALDQWIDSVLGLDPYVYRERVRGDALNQLLAERVTRAFLLQSDHAIVRVIVLKSETESKAAQEALAKGEAFEDVAKRLSSDASAKNGGRVPPVVRSDTAMSKIAFDTPIGAVSEPRYNQGAWLIAKVEDRPKPIEGRWNDIRATVMKSLADRPIEELEFSQWRTAMLRRYQVDITPFLRLAGQPVR